MAENEHNEIPENEQADVESPDIAAEMAALGKKFAEAINAAWQSEERAKLQEDIKDGLDRFVNEVDGAVKKLRDTDAAKKVEEGVQKTAENVKTGKVATDIRKGTVTALKSLSDALERMASSFTPSEDEETPQE